MAKRIKVDSLYIIISSFGYVVGFGSDPASAWRDAVENSEYSCPKDMMLSGRYASIETTANVTYEPAALEESRERFKTMRDEYYGGIDHG